jgi:hypothetical protein
MQPMMFVLLLLIFLKGFETKTNYYWIVWNIKNYRTSISKKFDKVIDWHFPMTLVGEHE